MPPSVSFPSASPQPTSAVPQLWSLILRVRPREAYQRLHLPLPRRERARGRPRQAAHHQESRPQGGRRRLRRTRAPGRLHHPLRRTHCRPLTPRGGQCRGARLQAHRRAAAVRSALGRDRLPGGGRRLAGRAQLRVCRRARGVRRRAAPDHGLRLGPRLREVDGRLRHPRRGWLGAASPLPRDGLVGRGVAGGTAGRSHGLRSTDGEGPHRGAIVRAPARPVQQTFDRVMDTTSLSFTGAGGETLGERGYTPRTTGPT